MKTKIFGGIDNNFSNYSKSKVVVLPVPYEGTVSYGKGASLGPSAILEASSHMELYDIELKNIYEIGISTANPVKLLTNPEKSLDNIYQACKKHIGAGKFLAILGGEHSITSACVKAHREKYPNISVLQIDAHSDLRQEYGELPEKPTIWSHASVMRRVSDMKIPIVQVGIRSMCDEEPSVIEKNPKIATFYAKDIVGKDGWMDKAIEKLSDQVYITFDVDGLDPSIMPSTGTPEPGGLSWYETIEFIRKVSLRKKIVGFDVVELAPIKGLDHPIFTAALLVYKMIGYAFECNK